MTYSGHTTPDIECSSDIGAVTSLKVQKDGTDGWYMTSAEVADTGSMVTSTFTCNCWLDDASGRSLEHILTPGNKRAFAFVLLMRKLAKYVQ